MTTRPKGSSFNLFDVIGAVSTNDMGPQGSDITAKLVTALQAGYPVFVAAGTWVISPITFPVRSKIFGMGIKSSLLLKAGANASAVTITDYCELSNFIIDGNKNNQGNGGCHGIDLNNAIGFKINDVDCINTRGSGFYTANNATEGRLDNCKAEGFTESGFKIIRAIRLTLNTPYALNSDPAATGDGIALTSEGANIGYININNPIALNIVGRGVVISGSGARNAYDINISNPQITNTSSHGMHVMSAEAVKIGDGTIYVPKGDGIRVEGDVISSRVAFVGVKSATGSGIREVINGVSPNANGFIYNVLRNNGNNVVTTTGANSFVV